MRCGHCGEPLPSGALFCGECGRAVQAGAPATPRTARVSMIAPVPPPPPPPTAVPIAAPPPIAAPAPGASWPPPPPSLPPSGAPVSLAPPPGFSPTVIVEPVELVELVETAEPPLEIDESAEVGDELDIVEPEPVVEPEPLVEPEPEPLVEPVVETNDPIEAVGLVETGDTGVATDSVPPPPHAPLLPPPPPEVVIAVVPPPPVLEPAPLPAAPQPAPVPALVPVTAPPMPEPSHPVVAASTDDVGVDPVLDGNVADALEDDIDDDPTTVSPRRVAPPVTATVVASTGQRFQIGGRVLLGRRPTPAPGEVYDSVLVLVDDGKTISKTHLELIADEDEIRVVDLGSGNGTVIETPGEPPVRCVAGVPHPVPRGSRLVIGRQFLVIA